MIYALDASAMVAYLRSEPGADLVRQILRDTTHTCYAHAVNLCEVYYGFARALGEPAAQSLTALRAAETACLSGWRKPHSSFPR
jgi:uncharacterized protein with PIN domain